MFAVSVGACLGDFVIGVRTAVVWEFVLVTINSDCCTVLERIFVGGQAFLVCRIELCFGRA